MDLRKVSIKEAAEKLKKVLDTHRIEGNKYYSGYGGTDGDIELENTYREEVRDIVELAGGTNITVENIERGLEKIEFTYNNITLDYLGERDFILGDQYNFLCELEEKLGKDIEFIEEES